MSDEVTQPILLVARDADDAARLKHRLRKWGFDVARISVAHDADAVERWKLIYKGEIIDGDAGVDACIESKLLEILGDHYAMRQTIEVMQTYTRKMEGVFKFSLRIKRDFYGHNGTKTGVIHTVKRTTEIMDRQSELLDSLQERLLEGDKVIERHNAYLTAGISAFSLYTACLCGLLYLILHYHGGP